MTTNNDQKSEADEWLDTYEAWLEESEQDPPPRSQSQQTNSMKQKSVSYCNSCGRIQQNSTTHQCPMKTKKQRNQIVKNNKKNVLKEKSKQQQRTQEKEEQHITTENPVERFDESGLVVEQYASVFAAATALGVTEDLVRAAMYCQSQNLNDSIQYQLLWEAISRRHPNESRPRSGSSDSSISGDVCIDIGRSKCAKLLPYYRTANKWKATGGWKHASENGGAKMRHKQCVGIATGDILRSGIPNFIVDDIKIIGGQKKSSRGRNSRTGGSAGSGGGGVTSPRRKYRDSHSVSTEINRDQLLSGRWEHRKTHNNEQTNYERVADYEAKSISTYSKLKPGEYARIGKSSANLFHVHEIPKRVDKTGIKPYGLY
mmetsp:Transcript_526/g.681  ORF Transcript_526/g.681 Transcript_526/m.681 type:complete len:372 (+) Transcript_526:71-1186(+)